MIVRARRGERPNLVAGSLVLAAGAVLGWSSDPAATEVGTWLAILSTAPWIVQVQWCLWSDAVRRDLLPLPLRPRAHFADGLAIALLRSAPAALAPLGFALGLARRSQEAAVHATIDCFVAWTAAIAIAALTAGLAGLFARRRGPTLSALQAWLSGGWAAPEHAPFFYAPALALSAVAVCTVSFGGRLELAAPLLPLLLAGAWGFGRSIFEVVPRVREHEALLRRPGETEDAPATIGWAASLPVASRPLHALFLRQSARRTRGRGVLVALGAAGLGVYLLRAASFAPLVGSAAVAAVVVLCRPALASSDESVFPAWLRTSLPVRSADVKVAAWLAALPTPVAAGLLTAALFATAGQAPSAAAVALAAVLSPALGAAAPRAPWILAATGLGIAALPLAVPAP